MKTRTLHRQSAALLIVVLVVCLGLVAIVLLFANTAIMGYRAADNDLAGRQAEQAVEAGGRYAGYLITNVETKGTLPDSTSYTANELPVGDATFWFIGRPTEALSNQTDPSWGLVDEASKLNLNSKSATKDVLMKLPGMNEDLAAAIVAWRTADSGDGDYAQRQPGYRNKGANFESTGELALLDGVDPSVLYGKDANLNGVLDSEENDVKSSLSTMSTSNVDGPGILEYVTVFSREANPENNPTTQAPRIKMWLATSATSEEGQKLRALLTANPKLAAKADQVLTAIFDASVAPPLTSALQFYVVSGLAAEEFDAIADDLRFSEDAYVYPVNVNTAGVEVLTAIGFTSDMAAAIITARSSSTATASITWLKDTLKGDLAKAKEVGPLITGKTFVISADVAAVGRLGRGYRRTRFVFDSSSGMQKLVYRRNLGQLGWALGREVRTILDEEKGRTP